MAIGYCTSQWGNCIHAVVPGESMSSFIAELHETKYQGSVLDDEFMYVKIVALQSVILG